MMDGRRADDGSHGPGIALKRRGILAAAGAAVAGIIAKQAAQPVRATSGSGDQGPLNLGSNPWYIAGSPAANAPAISSAPTVIQASTNFGNFVGGNGADPVLFEVDARPSLGTVDAIYGFTDGLGYGVIGSGLNGVFGTGTNSGVFGSGGTTGVIGSGGTIGVFGTGPTTGVRGDSTGGNGVLGIANAAGTSQVVAGVFGDSTTTYGVIGRTTAAGYSGLTAITGTAGVAALAATSTSASAFAAYFSGTTVVQGNFIAFGGGKSAAVPDASGQHRLVYCVESPEAWFEDFGKAKLVNGRTDVRLDPDFAAIVHADDYHVFLTAYGNTNGLHVTRQGAGGFTVEEHNGGTGGVTFSYRVVAKRKDIVGERLAKFSPPKINHPDPDKLPKLEPIPPSPPPRKP